jgi:hypothetical protein
VIAANTAVAATDARMRVPRPGSSRCGMSRSSQARSRPIRPTGSGRAGVAVSHRTTITQKPSISE